jgi:SHS2 domain-containing protein
MTDASKTAGYSWFDHTADVGVEVTAPSLEILFKTSAAALFDLLAERRSEVAASIQVEREIRVTGADREELLVRWLSELL